VSYGRVRRFYSIVRARGQTMAHSLVKMKLSVTCGSGKLPALPMML